MESESEGTEPVSDTDGSCSSSVEDTTSTDDYVSMKRPRYACTFRPDTNTFEWAKVLKKGASYAYCTVCSRNVSVAYGGRKDMKKHELTSVHQAASVSMRSTRSLTSYFSNTPGPKREQAVVEAEVKFSYFIAEHHLAFALADHCSKLFPSLSRFRCCKVF